MACKNSTNRVYSMGTEIIWRVIMEMENAQELIQRLNHSGKKLSKSHRRIAECIVSHYDKVVFMTASRLG